MATASGHCSSEGLSGCHLSLKLLLICGVGRVECMYLPEQYVYFPCIYSANIFLVHLVCLAPCLALDKVQTF